MWTSSENSGALLGKLGSLSCWSLVFRVCGAFGGVTSSLLKNFPLFAEFPIDIPSYNDYHSILWSNSSGEGSSPDEGRRKRKSSGGSLANSSAHSSEMDPSKAKMLVRKQLGQPGTRFFWFPFLLSELWFYSIHLVFFSLFFFFAVKWLEEFLGVFSLQTKLGSPF